jgi:hypothetical protein
MYWITGREWLMRFCEYGTELQVSIKCPEFLDSPNHYGILKKNGAERRLVNYLMLDIADCANGVTCIYLADNYMTERLSCPLQPAVNSYSCVFKCIHVTL